MSWCWNLWDVFSVSIEIQHDYFNFSFFVLHGFSYYELILQSWDLKVLLNLVHQNFAQYFHIFFRRESILMLSFSGFGVKVILTSCSEMWTIFFHSISDRDCPRTVCSSNIWQNFQIKQSSPSGSLKPFNCYSFFESYGVCLFPACTCINTY